MFWNEKRWKTYNAILEKYTNLCHQELISEKNSAVLEYLNERKLTKKEMIFFKIGWLFGFGYFVSNLYWITYSLTFEESFKFLIPIALIIIPLFLGLFYGFAILILSFFKLEKNFFLVLLFY